MGGSWDKRRLENQEGVKTIVEKMLLGKSGAVKEMANIAVILASARASM